MKNKIFLIAMLASSYVSIALSSECPPLQYLRTVIHVSRVQDSNNSFWDDHLQFWYDNESCIPIHYDSIKELKETPDNSSATFLHFQYSNAGIVIPADVIQKMKIMPTPDTSSTVSDYTYAINRFSPQQLLGKLKESNKLSNEDVIKKAEQEWLEARKNIQNINHPTVQTSYFKPAIIIAFIGAVGLYLFWRSR